MTLAIFQATIQDSLGNAVPGATVTVRRMSDNGLAALFTDEAGTISAGNPVVSDPDGYVFFYVIGGKYRITAQSGSFTRVWPDVLIGTIQQFDADTYPPSGGGTAIAGVIGNGKLTVSVAANEVTFALKTLADTDPSVGNPVVAIFPDGTTRTITSAISLLVTVGSTLGVLANTPFRIWSALVDDAGTVRLAIRNCYNRASATSSDDSVVGFMVSTINATAEGGAGGADTAQISYANAAFSAKYYLILGFADWDNGLATPGTWSSGPDRTIQFNATVPLPGVTIQTRKNATAAVATGTTIIPPDNTKPQNTEGTQFLSQSVTPGARQNLLVVEVQVAGALNVVATIIAAMFQDSGVDSIYSAWTTCDVGGDARTIVMKHHIQAAVVTSTTFKARLGPNTSGGGATFTMNGNAGAGFFNGTLFSFIEITERMG